MSGVMALAREDLRSVRPYVPGAYEAGFVRMNANESPWRLPTDATERGLNVYPPPRPEMLRERLAAHYGVAAERLLVTRGSSEAIDVLIRGFCAAGRDSIAICPPTFDMYRLYATIQGAGIVQVPQIRDHDGVAIDVDALVAACDASTKLVFVCSPNNPTGTSVPEARLAAICEAFAGRALVVIDEAYHEFARRHCLALADRHEHVVLLRTMSKFLALAGARCGTVIADPRVVEFLGTVLPPYTFPTPSIELVLEALSEESLRVAGERIELIVSERERLARALDDLPRVVGVYPSDANFVLVELRDAERFESDARAAGILVRRFRDDPALAGCVRVTVGTPKDNDRLLQAVSGVDVAGEARS